MTIFALAFVGMAWYGLRHAPRSAITGHRLGLLGFIGDAVGGLARGVGRIAQAAAPIASIAAPFIPGIGPIAAAALPALGALSASSQGRQDSAASRQFAQGAADLTQQNAMRAQAEFAANEPLRQAFRAGALSFGDPTNPFSQLYSGIIQNAAQAAHQIRPHSERQKQPAKQGGQQQSTQSSIIRAAQAASEGGFEGMGDLEGMAA